MSHKVESIYDLALDRKSLLTSVLVYGPEFPSLPTLLFTSPSPLKGHSLLLFIALQHLRAALPPYTVKYFQEELCCIVTFPYPMICSTVNTEYLK